MRKLITFFLLISLLFTITSSGLASSNEYAIKVEDQVLKMKDFEKRLERLQEIPEQKRKSDGVNKYTILGNFTAYVLVKKQAEKLNLKVDVIRLDARSKIGNAAHKQNTTASDYATNRARTFKQLTEDIFVGMARNKIRNSYTKIANKKIKPEIVDSLLEKTDIPSELETGNLFEKAPIKKWLIDSLREVKVNDLYRKNMIDTFNQMDIKVNKNFDIEKVLKKINI